MIEIYFSQQDSWYNGVLVDFLGALFGFGFALLAFFISVRREDKKDADRLQSIKGIIIRNLEEIKKRAFNLKCNYGEIIKKINNPKTQVVHHSIQGFNTKVFDSHSLTDYAQIFKKDEGYVLLINIYDIIQDMKPKLPERILENHKHDFEHLRVVYPNGNNPSSGHQYNSFTDAVRGLTEKNTHFTKVMEQNVDVVINLIDEFLIKHK